MAYIDNNSPHAGSAEVLYTGLFDEPAGTVAHTLFRSDCSSVTIGPTTGQVFAHALPLPQALVINNIAVHTGSTAASSPTHFWLAVTDQYLNVLAVTADQGSTAIGSATFFKLAVTVPYTVQFTGLYYVIGAISATVTMPTLAGAPAVASGLGAVAPVHTGTAGTQATPPAVGTQVNSGTITGNGAMNFGAWIS